MPNTVQCGRSWLAAPLVLAGAFFVCRPGALSLRATDSPCTGVTCCGLVRAGAIRRFFFQAFSLAAILYLGVSSLKAGVKTWGNTGTDFNTATNWSTGALPKQPGDTAAFSGPEVTNPNLSASYEIAAITFSATNSSGYTLSSSNTSITLTLDSTGTGSLSAIYAANTSGTNTISAPVIFGASAASTQSIDLVSGSTLAISGVISSTNNVTISKDDSGTLILSGANTYVGATTITGGVLNIRNASALGTTAGGTTVSSGAALQIQNGIAVGAEALTLNGGGVASDGALRNISSNNSWSGNITLASASTIASDSGTLTLSGTLTNGGFGLTVSGAGNVSESGVVSGTGGLTKSGSGTLTLSNTGNTYSGQLTVQAGTLSVDTINNASANGELGNNALSVILGSSGTTGTLEYTGVTASSTKKFTMATGGTGAFQIDTAGTTLTLSGAIDGSGALNKTGAGTLVLSGANSYSGGTNINAGILNVGSSGALGSSGTIGFGGGTLQYSASNTTDYSARFSTAASQAISIDTNGQNVIFATALTSSGGSLTKAGTGTLTLSAANTYTGGTTVSAGTLQLSGSGTLGSTSGSLTINGGYLDLNGTNQTVGTLSGTGGTILNNSTGTAKTLTVGQGNGTGSYAGVISDHTSGTGTLGLTKTGTGTQTLTGSNTFTGTTTVNGGTLTLAATSGSALGSTTSIMVNSSGTLMLGATDQINNSATMTLAGGTFSKGAYSEGGVNAVGIGALTLTSNSHIDFGTGTVGILTFASLTTNSQILTIDNWTGTANHVGSAGTDRLIFDSDQSANLNNFSFTGYGTSAVEFYLGNGYWEVVATPEPSTWATGILSLGAVICWHVRRAANRKNTAKNKSA